MATSIAGLTLFFFPACRPIADIFPELLIPWTFLSWACNLLLQCHAFSVVPVLLDAQGELLQQLLGNKPSQCTPQGQRH